MSYQQKGEVGVGGWLRILILILCIFTPLAGLAILTTDIAAAERATPQLKLLAAWDDAKVIFWVSYALRTTALFYAGWRLRAVHRSSSVRIALWALWLAGPVAIAATNLIVSDGMGQQQLAWSAPLGWPIASAVIWSAYLVTSDRVAVTYVPRVELEPVGDNKENRSLPRISLDVRQRQRLFAALLWPIVIMIFGLVLDKRYDGVFRNGMTLDSGRLLAWAFIPPALFYLARWFYSKFVIVEK